MRVPGGPVNDSGELIAGLICEETKNESQKWPVKRYSSQGWSLDQITIFALVDSFVQRCKDLIEVCEYQQQFARWEEGERVPLPCFAGRQGSEVTQRLLYIEATFDNSLQVLRSVKDILDVRNPSWHEDYSRQFGCLSEYHHDRLCDGTWAAHQPPETIIPHIPAPGTDGPWEREQCASENVRLMAMMDWGRGGFRAKVKDLEVMMQNLITSTFETVNCVEEGVQLLDVFQHLSGREAIKRTIDRKTVDVYALLSAELCDINLVLRRAHFLPHVSSAEEVHVNYAKLCQTLDERVRRIFTDWSQSLNRECLSSLNQPLMIRCKGKTGLLDINFNKNLLKMFNEIHYWDRLLFEIPHYATEVYQRREELHNLRENVLLVVRDYNRIIKALNADELGLFSERIRFLDRKIQPGLSKLHWSTKGTSSVFINDCRVHANKVQLMVDEYKAANLAASKLCEQISELLLVRVDGKMVYGDLEFQEDQQSHQHSQLLRLQNAHQDIIKNLARVYGTFHLDGPEVQQHWVSYMEKMDRMVEEAFRVNIKRSLQELSKAINGDGKTSPNPLFRVEVVLTQQTPRSPAQVDFSPSLQKLAHIVNSISSQLIKTISGFKRLPDLLTRQHSQRKPIHIIIEQDEEICKIQGAIAAGMVTNASYLQTYLKTWDKHREIWEIEKDGFIQRYQRLNPTVTSFDADIARYTEVANNVQKEETVLSLQFVLLDCSPLKFSLLQHCNEWQSKVSQPPQTLPELGESLKLLETLQADLSKIESQIPPIHEQFAILEKYEVAVDPAVLELLEALNSEWVWFQQVVIDSDIMLKKHKDMMKSGLILSSEEFKKKTQSALQSFNSSGEHTHTHTHTHTSARYMGGTAGLCFLGPWVFCVAGSAG
ncbi:Dynein axonemal heavy chain 2 [Labeo rohita]|uniref:Dynein axonemal heavy chain 2 n=1 Tax=Labeo rohita TaxID=84645 RepID=A0ABQ8MJI1_LABRO|nr:Dynein axonemal heavy chain 2 [Labeo rohita]